MASPKTLQSEAVKKQIRPVSRSSVSENIAQQILDLIASGKLMPGQRLPSERELCKSFGAGRSSVREALRSLAMLDILEARVGDGTVTAVDGSKFLNKVLKWRLITQRHDVEQLLNVRLALECYAVSEAARVRAAEDIEHLSQLIEQMRGFVKQAPRFATVDLQFHLAIARMSGNTLLFDMISMIRGQVIDAIEHVFRHPNALPLSLAEHEEIVSAIRRQKPELAEKAMKVHLNAAITRYRAVTGHGQLEPPPAPRAGTRSSSTPARSSDTKPRGSRSSNGARSSA